MNGAGAVPGGGALARAPECTRRLGLAAVPPRPAPRRRSARQRGAAPPAGTRRGRPERLGPGPRSLGRGGRLCFGARGSCAFMSRTHHLQHLHLTEVQGWLHLQLEPDRKAERGRPYCFRPRRANCLTPTSPVKFARSACRCRSCRLRGMEPACARTEPHLPLGPHVPHESPFPVAMSTPTEPEDGGSTCLCCQAVVAFQFGTGEKIHIKPWPSRDTLLQSLCAQHRKSRKHARRKRKSRKRKQAEVGTGSPAARAKDGSPDEQWALGSVKHRLVEKFKTRQRDDPTTAPSCNRCRCRPVASNESKRCKVCAQAQAMAQATKRAKSSVADQQRQSSPAFEEIRLVRRSAVTSVPRRVARNGLGQGPQASGSASREISQVAPCACTRVRVGLARCMQLVGALIGSPSPCPPTSGRAC